MGNRGHLGQRGLNEQSEKSCSMCSRVDMGDRGWQKVRPGRKRGQECCCFCESEAFGLTRVRPNTVLLIKYSVCDDFIPQKT